MTSWKPPYVFLSTRRHIPLWKCVQATSLSWIWRANDWSLAQFQPLWRPYWMWQFPAEGKSHSHRNRTLALTPAPFQRNCLGRHLRNILLCQLKDMYFHITEAFNKAMIWGDIWHSTMPWRKHFAFHPPRLRGNNAFWKCAFMYFRVVLATAAFTAQLFERRQYVSDVFRLFILKINQDFFFFVFQANFKVKFDLKSPTGENAPPLLLLFNNGRWPGRT